MAGLFAYGLLTAVGIAVCILITIIGLFVGQIILFDSIALSIAAAIVCYQLWSIHPAFCLLIGIALFIFLFWLQNTKVGFGSLGFCCRSYGRSFSVSSPIRRRAGI